MNNENIQQQLLKVSKVLTFVFILFAMTIIPNRMTSAATVTIFDKTVKGYQGPADYTATSTTYNCADYTSIYHAYTENEHTNYDGGSSKVTINYSDGSSVEVGHNKTVNISKTTGTFTVSIVMHAGWRDHDNGWTQSVITSKVTAEKNAHQHSYTITDMSHLHALHNIWLYIKQTTVP